MYLKFGTGLHSKVCELISFKVCVIMIIVIVTLKGTVVDFVQSPHNAVNCLQQVCSSGPGAVVCNHVQHIERLSRARCHVTCHGVQRDISAIKFHKI